MRLVLAAMAGVGTAFAVVLGVAFSIRPQVHVSDNAFGTAAGLAIVVISVAITCAIARISPWKPAQRAFDRFLYRLQHPTPKPLPPGVDRRSSAQIDYAKDRTATASCPHLEPVERAMRTAGVAVRLLGLSDYGPIIAAGCRVNFTDLQRRFSLPATIEYRERYEPERTAHDLPRADLICLDCLVTDRARCDILVLHPDECRPDTPWFPAPPATPPLLPRLNP